MPIPYDHDHENEVTLFAETNFRNQRRRFGIKTDDRRRHMYILGKTGMGKTTLLENMVLSDIYAGHGVAYVDPHGDTAEKILDYIPSNRINDVVYFNPADMQYPVGFNILETANDEQKHLVASGLMGVFKKIWPDVWSPRMEYILLNCVLALLDYPGATLLGINRLLVDKEYRSRVIAKIRNPIVKTFWVAEFTSWSEKYATEAIAPVQNKVGQFLSASIIRNIVAQVKSSINPRQVMDEGKIFIVNLSKGKIGEDNMRLLGGMIVTKIQLAAMERVDIKHEVDRRDFYLYVDEFQNFATQSFANILSEARKYRLNLTVAHQYIEQLEEEVRDAVFGNVGSLLIMRVGAQDATFMETEFAPTYLPEDLTNLAKYQMYLKLMVDGVATAPFSANTLPPIGKPTGSEDKVIAVSRERYAEPRAVIEEKVLRWSGMEAGPPTASLEEAVLGGAPSAGAVAYPKILTADEREAREALGGLPAGLKPGTPEYAKAGIAALEGEAAVAETEEYLRISPERLAAIRPAGAKKEKPKFKHTCTRCGKTWDMPVQLDPARPMYCAECLPIIREERKFKTNIVKTAVRSGPPADMGAHVVEEEDTVSRRASPLHEVMKAAEEGRPARPSAPPRQFPPRPSAPPKSPSPTPPNRPRLVVTNAESLTDLVDDARDENRSFLLDDVARSKGRPVETRKQAVTPSAPRITQQPREPRRREDRRPPRGPRPDHSGPPKNAFPDLDLGSPPKPPHTPKKSIEDLFRDAEERTDRDIVGKVQMNEPDPSASSGPAVVFRNDSSPQSSGPKPVQPGQRVRFDE